MKQYFRMLSFGIVVLVMTLGLLSSCVSTPTANNATAYSTETSKANNDSTTQKQSSKSNESTEKATMSVSFTNKYGTPTTKCAHSGCSNYIASSGDTNCCPTHSRKCLSCGKYIDEDATYCMDCLGKAAKKANDKTTSKSGSSKGPWHSSNVKSDGMGPYYCMGKNDTCNNKTYNCHDMYCDSCDPDGDNKEG